jgi:GT2 family glycosyltransferase
MIQVKSFVIIIPSFRSQEILYAIVKKIVDEAIRFSLFNKGLRAVIIVDFKTPMRLLSRIKTLDPRIVILKQDVDRGLPFQRLLGVTLAKKLGVDYVIFIDNDVLPTQGFGECIIQALKLLNIRKDLAAVEFELLNLDGSVQRCGALMDNSAYVIPLTSSKTIRLTAYPAGGAFLVKMSALHKSGLWSREFPFWYDDTDLGLRLWKNGFKVLASNLCKFYHISGLSRKSLPLAEKLKKEVQDFYMARLRFVIRHFGIYQIMSALVLIAIDVLHRVYATLRGDHVAKMMLIYMLKGIFHGLTKSKIERVEHSSSENRTLLKSLIRIAQKEHIRIAFGLNK